jgi:predicted NAD-dependent protein-ADP-ribosyltransferase YbiA (DUF1768 family)
MSTRFGIKLFDVQFIASEILYMIAGFKDKSIQEELLRENNPTKAKRIFRNGIYKEKYWRKDWHQFNLDWMKFCISQKYLQNPEWVKLLNSTKGKIILEDSSMHRGNTSFYWGAKNLLKAKIIRERCSSLREELSHLSKSQKKKEVENLAEYLYPITVGDGYYQGVNNMGKLLTILRDNNGILDYSLPNNIYILGNKVESYLK